MKRTLLSLCRALGVFRLCRALTKHRLRILCYHGFSLDDEHLFKPKLFMQPSTFRARLDFLERHHYRIVSLDEGLDALESGRLDESVVLTLDDGWVGVAEHGAPELSRRGIPSTLYLTSYYAKHQNPVFRVAMQYAFWKTTKTVGDFSGLCDGVGSSESLSGANTERVLWKLIDHGEDVLDEAGRNELLAAVSARLEVDPRRFTHKRMFGLVSTEQAAALMREGMDIQLHTHRHRSPEDPTEMDDEITRNREIVSEVTGDARQHFCYPSGEWRYAQLAQLAALDIRSATTCDPGSNPIGSNPLALKRFLDSETFSELEFEAEISGFKDVLREMKSRIRGSAS